MSLLTLHKNRKDKEKESFVTSLPQAARPYERETETRREDDVGHKKPAPPSVFFLYVLFYVLFFFFFFVLFSYFCFFSVGKKKREGIQGAYKVEYKLSSKNTTEYKEYKNTSLKKNLYRVR